MSNKAKTARELNKEKPESQKKFLKKLKNIVSKKTFNNPMKMERKKEGFRSKNPNVKFMDEMNAMTMGLDTLTSKGPGKVKVGSMAKGGRAGFKHGSKGCKLAMKGKGRAYGKNS